MTASLGKLWQKNPSLSAFSLSLLAHAFILLPLLLENSPKKFNPSKATTTQSSPFQTKQASTQRIALLPSANFPSVVFPAPSAISSTTASQPNQQNTQLSPPPLPSWILPQAPPANIPKLKPKPSKQANITQLSFRYPKLKINQLNQASNRYLPPAHSRTSQAAKIELTKRNTANPSQKTTQLFLSTPPLPKTKVIITQELHQEFQALKLPPLSSPLRIPILITPHGKLSSAIISPKLEKEQRLALEKWLKKLPLKSIQTFSNSTSSQSSQTPSTAAQPALLTILPSPK